MKRFLLGISIILPLFLCYITAQAQSQTVINGHPATAVTFPNSGCFYNWVNNKPGIGLAASGTGDIASFTVVNTGSSPVIATVTATAVPIGYAYVANYNSGNVSVINTATNTVVTTIPVESGPTAVSVTPDGSFVYVVNSTSNDVSVISTASNTVVAVDDVGNLPSAVAISPDGSLIYVSNLYDGTVSVIKAAFNSVITTIPGFNQPYFLATNPADGTLYVANSPLGTISVVNPATNAIVANITVGADPTSVLVSPDGSQVYTTNQLDNTVSVINAATNTVVATIPVGNAPYGEAISPDGSFLYVVNRSSGTISVINTSTNAVVNTININDSPTGISVTADGKYIYAVNDLTPGGALVISTATNSVVQTVPVGAYPNFLGNFIAGGKASCSPVNFTITVNPTPPISAGITVSQASGNIFACLHVPSANPDIQLFTVSGIDLTGNITITAPTGFEVSLSAGSGYGNGASVTQVAGTVNNTTIYVRSAATAPGGGITGKVTLTTPGYAAQTVAVIGFVNPSPTVDKINGQVVNNGAATAAVNFTGAANTFNWVNNTPSIGLAASGTANIASFTAVNTGSSPVTATITVTPSSNQLAYIANAGSNSVSVINTNTNTVTDTIAVGTQPNGIAVSPDGSRVYVGNGTSSSISVINTTTNAVVATVPVGMVPLGILVSPDGSKVYVVNNSSSSISVISTATNTVSSTIPLDSSSPEYIAGNTDGSMLYVTNFQSNSVSVISTVSNTVVSTIAVGSSPFSISASPDGGRLYVSNFSSNNVSVINTSTNTVVATVPVGISPYGTTVSPDGSLAYVANSGSGTVSVINTATNTVVGTIAVGTFPYGISVSPDGTQVYVSNYSSNNVSVINTATSAVTATLAVGSRPVSVGNFIIPGTGCAGAPATFTIEVDPTPVITAGAVTGSISACSGLASISPGVQQFTVSGINLTGNITVTAPPGGQFEVSLAAGGGYNSTVSLVPSAGVVSNTVVYVRSSSSAAPGNISGAITLTSPGATGQNAAVAGIVTASTVPLVSIAVPANNICVGTAATFTATPVNGGTAPVYQWLLNGNNAGTNNATFMSSTLTNGDIVSCIMTSNIACSVPANATSNSITMNVISPVAPSVSIATPANIICAGSPVTFTATPINGGDAPVYQWMVNGNNSGPNTSAYTGNTFADGDVVSCSMTSNAACATPVSATSNSITLKVNSPSVVNSGGDKAITAGNSIQLNATATGNIADIAWSPATGLSNTKILEPVASPTVTTTYTLTVQTTDGCISTTDVTITVTLPSVSIPNTFTPNADGINDTWDIKNLDYYLNCTVQVFNRWGQNVYSSIGYPIPWNGTYRDATLPTGTYYYIINLKNGLKALSGYIVIIR